MSSHNQYNHHCDIPFYDVMYEPTATSTFQHDFDYLVVIDLEATCDNGTSPKVTADTQEVIEFPFVIIELLPCDNVELSDVPLMRIVEQHQYYAKPEWSSELTDFCTDLTGITNETLETYGRSLRQIIKIFDDYVTDHFEKQNKKWCIITDGEWDLKQLLLREAAKKRIPLAKHYRSFFDLRREYKTCFPYAPIKGLVSMVNHANIEFVGRHHSGISDCLTICELISVMLQSGHMFYEENRVVIDDHYDPFRDRSFVDFNITRSNSFGSASSRYSPSKVYHPHYNSGSGYYSESYNAPMYSYGLFIPEEHYDPAFSEIYQKELEQQKETYYYSSPDQTTKYLSSQEKQPVYYTYPKRKTKYSNSKRKKKNETSIHGVILYSGKRNKNMNQRGGVSDSPESTRTQRTSNGTPSSSSCGGITQLEILVEQKLTIQ